MKNYTIIVLSMGIFVTNIGAGDAYDVMNPRETMNPWIPTKGELRFRQKRMQDYYNDLYNRKYKGMGRYSVTMAERQDLPKFRRLEEDYQNTFDAYYNSRQFNWPHFPRAARARESLRSWIASWYK